MVAFGANFDHEGGMSLGPSRQQDLYWAQLVQLKVDCEYMRRYRNALAGWLTRFAVLRAVASMSAIGAWAVVRAYPWIWALIIALAQVADALQQSIPFNRRQQAASELVTVLDRLFIDAQMEWEAVFGGKLDSDQIILRRHRLMMLNHEMQTKHFPMGLPERPALLALAERDAAAYLTFIYSVEREA